jgi:ribosomal RNA-processing protein 36
MSYSKAASQPLEEASSSSDDDDGDFDDESEVEEAPLIKSFEDLPSEDSVSLDSDDDEDDDKPIPSFMIDDDKKTNGLSLSEKLERKNEAGVYALKQRRDRRIAALAEAKARLKQDKKAKATSPEAEQHQQQKNAPIDGKAKKTKHAPTEVSSKRKDYFNRGAPQLNSAGIGIEIGAHRYKPRDPRMSSMSGRLQEDHFEHHYGFLQDLRQEEIDALQRRIKARKVQGKKGQRLRQKLGLTTENAPSLEDDQQQLLTLKQQMAQFEKNQVDRAAKQSVKRKIREEVESGQRCAYFIKRAEKKKMELEARFEELSKRGDLMKIMAKKRKKNKSKDASLMK